jgi:hypothetical protein
MAKPVVPTPRAGLHVGWILAGAAVLGIVAGVGLSLKRLEETEDSMVELEQQAIDLTPLGTEMEPRSKTNPMAPDPAALFGIPPYPNAAPRKLASSPKGQGVPMAINWFTTRDSVENVLAYYDEFFTLLKLLHSKHLYGPNSGYVGWLEHDQNPDAGSGEGVMHMVSAIRQGNETLVLLSATDPLRMLSAAAPELPPGVVLPPDAKTPRVFDLGEGRMSRLSIHTSVLHGDLAETLAFYDRHFQQGEWTVIERSTADTRATLSARRKSVVQSIVLTRTGAGVQVMLNYDELGPSGAGAKP